jgi:hypothetical protein
MPEDQDNRLIIALTVLPTLRECLLQTLSKDDILHLCQASQSVNSVLSSRMPILTSNGTVLQRHVRIVDNRANFVLVPMKNQKEAEWVTWMGQDCDNISRDTYLATIKKVLHISRAATVVEFDAVPFLSITWLRASRFDMFPRIRKLRITQCFPLDATSLLDTQGGFQESLLDYYHLIDVEVAPYPGPCLTKDWNSVGRCGSLGEVMNIVVYLSQQHPSLLLHDNPLRRYIVWLAVNDRLLDAPELTRLFQKYLKKLGGNEDGVKDSMTIKKELTRILMTPFRSTSKEAWMFDCIMCASASGPLPGICFSKKQRDNDDPICGACQRSILVALSVERHVAKSFGIDVMSFLDTNVGFGWE